MSPPVSITQDLNRKPFAGPSEDPLLFSNLSLPYYYFDGQEESPELAASPPNQKASSCLVTVSQEPNSYKNDAQNQASWLQESKRTYGWQIALHLLLLLGGIGILCGGYFLLATFQKRRT
jgi:hypothetical protein